MSDLVERLHKWVSYSNGIPSQPEICKEAADEIERLRAERDALRALLRRVLSCGLNEEPHGVGFTPSRQEKKAGELARDIEAALGKDAE